MRVKDVMSKSVITVTPDTRIADAVSRMTSARISGLPVVDDAGHLVGMLSESDLLRRSELGTQKTRRRWLSWLVEPGTLAEDYVRANARRVVDVMTPDVVSVDEAASVAEAANLMERHTVKRLPVLRGDVLVGLVARSDLIRALGGFLKETYEDTITTDREILQAVRSELEGQSWAPRDSIDISVNDGVVDLRGSIFDERQRGAIRVAAETVRGVKAVHDHMIWVEPFSGTVIPSPEDAAEKADRPI